MHINLWAVKQRYSDSCTMLRGCREVGYSLRSRTCSKQPGPGTGTTSTRRMSSVTRFNRYTEHHLGVGRWCRNEIVLSHNSQHNIHNIKLMLVKQRYSHRFSDADAAAKRFDTVCGRGNVQRNWLPGEQQLRRAGETP